MEGALESLDVCLHAPAGIYPRREVRVTVDRTRCIGCGICVSMAPELMRLDDQRLAYADPAVVNWSPADGGFVRHCPTRAIVAHDAVTGELADNAEQISIERVERPRIR